MNSSRTWKSGEVCQITGEYRCVACHLAGRNVIGTFEAGKILPLCEGCPDKDATWRLVRAGRSAGANP